MVTAECCLMVLYFQTKKHTLYYYDTSNIIAKTDVNLQYKVIVTVGPARPGQSQSTYIRKIILKFVQCLRIIVAKTYRSAVTTKLRQTKIVLPSLAFRIRHNANLCGLTSDQLQISYLVATVSPILVHVLFFPPSLVPAPPSYPLRFPAPSSKSKLSHSLRADFCDSLTCYT